MFIKSIKTILAVGIVASGAALTSASTANAGNGFSVQIGGGHGNGFSFGNGGHRNKGHGIRRGHGFKKHHGARKNYGHKRVNQRSGCSPRHALHKAYNIGLNQPHVERVNHKKIVVTGYNRGHLAKIVFKRKGHGCKVIKTRGLY